MNKMSTSAQENNLSNPHPHWGSGWMGFKSLQIVFQQKIQICTENSHSLTPTLHGSGMESMCIFFLLGIISNIQICTEIRAGCMGSIFEEKIFAVNWVKCPDLHSKMMFGSRNSWEMISISPLNALSRSTVPFTSPASVPLCAHLEPVKLEYLLFDLFCYLLTDSVL